MIGCCLTLEMFRLIFPSLYILQVHNHSFPLCSLPFNQSHSSHSDCSLDEEERLSTSNPCIGSCPNITMKERYCHSSVMPLRCFLVLKHTRVFVETRTQSKQTYSVVNTTSIINSPVLSFPGRNHSTQQTETQPAAWDLLLPCGKSYPGLSHASDSGSELDVFD